MGETGKPETRSGKYFAQIFHLISSDMNKRGISFLRTNITIKNENFIFRNYLEKSDFEWNWILEKFLLKIQLRFLRASWKFFNASGGRLHYRRKNLIEKFLAGKNSDCGILNTKNKFLIGVWFCTNGTFRFQVVSFIAELYE